MILITGGAGVLGSSLARRLARAAHRVRVLVLPKDRELADLMCPACEIAVGDITDRVSLQAPMRGVDTVYHLAAVILARDGSIFQKVNTEGTRNVVDAAVSAGVRHIIYVSSASVTYSRSTPYSRSKLEGEKFVRAAGCGWTIARPTLIYGRRGGQEIEMLCSWIKRLPVVPLIGRGRARKRPVFADDVVEALAAMAGNGKSYGKTYNLSGGEAISMLELAKLLARQIGVSRNFLPLPEWLWRMALAPTGAFAEHVLAAFSEDADLDNSEARQDLGFSPIPASIGIPMYFHRWQASPRV